MKQTLISYLFGAALACAAAQAAEKPNIVHIVADDLGWKDVGFNGCTDIKTPHLDKLAAEGAKLTQFYVQPMCTPTRAALMTGRYPFRYGLQTAVIPSVSAYGLDTTEWLLPQCLKEAGYQTAIIGKWHLGHADKKWWPRQRGFDYQYGAMIGELDYFTHEEHHVLDWYRDNKPVREKGYTTQLIGNDAVRLIEKHDPSTPLYLYLTFNAPHTPYQAPQEYIDRYQHIQDPTRRIYAGMVACLDDEIGRVVAALDKKGMRDNTLILFHSDNGGTKNAMFAGVMADMSKIKIPCDNGPYRDGKGSLFEGATRVCALRQLARPHQGSDRGRTDPRRGHLSDAGRSGGRLHRQMQTARRRERLGHHRRRQALAALRVRLQHRALPRGAATGRLEAHLAQHASLQR